MESADILLTSHEKDGKRRSFCRSTRETTLYLCAIGSVREFSCAAVSCKPERTLTDSSFDRPTCQWLAEVNHALLFSLVQHLHAFLKSLYFPRCYPPLTFCRQTSRLPSTVAFPKCELIKRVKMGMLNRITGFFINIFIFSWDFSLFILNMLSPSLKPGQVVPVHAAGYNLAWPDYVPPKEGDSRSACPMVNAMANHGILPHDGKNITFKELNMKVRQTYNFAPSFCFFVPKFCADFLNRSYWTGQFDLAELSLHNAIEHDASLTREDAALVPDQGKPDLKLVHDLLKEATGKMPDGSPRLTIPDLSRALSKRRVDARKKNKQYTESFFHNVFGSSKCVLALSLHLVLNV